MSPSLKFEALYLRENGPIVEVVIKPSSSTVASLNLERKDVPWVKVKALIDTGASSTSISEEVVKKLNLVSRGTAKVHTSAKTAEMRDKYDVCVEFDTDSYIDMLYVFIANLKDHSIDCLIGRDILSYCTFTYAGPEKRFVLSFGED